MIVCVRSGGGLGRYSGVGGGGWYLSLFSKSTTRLLCALSCPFLLPTSLWPTEY